MDLILPNKIIRLLSQPTQSTSRQPISISIRAFGFRLTRGPALGLFMGTGDEQKMFHYFEGAFYRQTNKSKFSSISSLQLVVPMNNKHVNMMTGAAGLHILSKLVLYGYAYMKVTFSFTADINLLLQTKSHYGCHAAEL
jgi:hypothetical protein